MHGFEVYRLNNYVHVVMCTYCALDEALYKVYDNLSKNLLLFLSSNQNEKIVRQILLKLFLLGTPM